MLLALNRVKWSNAAKVEEQCIRHLLACRFKKASHLLVWFLMKTHTVCSDMTIITVSLHWSKN